MKAPIWRQLQKSILVMWWGPKISLLKSRSHLEMQTWAKFCKKKKKKKIEQEMSKPSKNNRQNWNLIFFFLLQKKKVPDWMHLVKPPGVSMSQCIISWRRLGITVLRLPNCPPRLIFLYRQSEILRRSDMISIGSNFPHSRKFSKRIMICTAWDVTWTWNSQLPKNLKVRNSQNSLSSFCWSCLATGYTFFFPHNVDFRGRTYPIPPHLNHMGSDFCRGILTFDNGKALGERGLYWLKIHLANVFGKDKLSFEQRLDFTESEMENIIDR